MNDLFDKEESFLCHSELSKAHIQTVRKRMLGYLGKYSDPDYTSEYAYQTYERVYGKNDKKTIDSLSWLITSLRDNGHYAEALSLAEDLVERTTETYGKEEDHSAGSRPYKDRTGRGV